MPRLRVLVWIALTFYLSNNNEYNVYPVNLNFHYIVLFRVSMNLLTCCQHHKYRALGSVALQSMQNMYLMKGQFKHANKNYDLFMIPEIIFFRCKIVLCSDNSLRSVLEPYYEAILIITKA